MNLALQVQRASCARPLPFCETNPAPSAGFPPASLGGIVDESSLSAASGRESRTSEQVARPSARLSPLPHHHHHLLPPTAPTARPTASPPRRRRFRGSSAEPTHGRAEAHGDARPHRTWVRPNPTRITLTTDCSLFLCPYCTPGCTLISANPSTRRGKKSLLDCGLMRSGGAGTGHGIASPCLQTAAAAPPLGWRSRAPTAAPGPPRGQRPNYGRPARDGCAWERVLCTRLREKVKIQAFRGQHPAILTVFVPNRLATLAVGDKT